MLTSKRKNNLDGSYTTRMMRTIPLMQALRVGSEELDANRSGYMTALQRLNFQRVQRRNLIVVLVVSIIPLIYVMGYVILLLQNNVAVSPYAVIMAILVLALAYSGLIFWHDCRTQKLLHTQVLSLQGAVERYSRQGAKGATSYELRILDESFPVGKHIHNAFIEGENYILYYLAGTRYLLSAEAIDERSR
jgi:hypothetical protein